MAEHCTINVQEAYEYVFNGVTLGEATVFKEIRRLGLFERLVLEPSPSTCHAPNSNFFPRKTMAASLNSWSATSELFWTYAATLTRLFGDNIKVALSAGYDSRFLLALFRRAGITPKLFVYGSSGAILDVRIAKTIAQAASASRSTMWTKKRSSSNRRLKRRGKSSSGISFAKTDFPMAAFSATAPNSPRAAAKKRERSPACEWRRGRDFPQFLHNLPKQRSLTPRQFVWVFYRQF